MPIEYDIETDDLVFSSGRRVPTNYGIVGISDNLQLYEGFDSGIDTDDFTEEECIELSRYMRELWTFWVMAQQQKRVLDDD